MRIQLMIPCLVEDCLPEIGLAVVSVLERLGLAVDHPGGQTCCGQMAWKAGDLGNARALALRSLDLFAGPGAVVCPSGSCAKMLRTYPELFPPGTAAHARAVALAGRVFEFCEFLAGLPGAPDFGAGLPARAALHRSCQLDGSEAPARLLGAVRGLTLLEPERPDRCCGFGGQFSLQFPGVSASLLEDKVRELLALDPDLLVSAEPSCLMNIGGGLARLGRPVRALHVAQVLDLGLTGGAAWT
ncbi:MAG: (Fe-S)-binding protein [Proteobacteria bacterium]|nr:(Fe-S)-binding protein [Pseudomonadota bacterium]MBU1593923.1 (Fe-S)-binding protein [Pseudomonadota bacterium]